MSSPTTTPTPNLSPLGHHLATHILNTLTQAQYLSTKLLLKKSLFTRATFKEAFRNPLHPSRDALELCIYTYQSLHECLRARMHTPWDLQRAILGAAFPVVHDWVCELKGSEKRDVRNLIAHTFNTGREYRDLYNRLECVDEGDAMMESKLGAGVFWDLVERDVVALARELEFAIGVFTEQVRDMPVEERVEEVRVVEDFSVRIPEEWSQGENELWDTTPTPAPVRWRRLVRVLRSRALFRILRRV